MPETAEEKAAREARESRNGDRGAGRRYASPEEIAGQVARLLATNNNDSQRVITQLINDNRTARDKLRAAREAQAAAEAKVPAGAVVLSADDAKKWEAFKGLNLKPDEVKAKIEQATKLEAEKQQQAKAVTLKEAAKELGYPNADLFVELVNDKKLHVEMRDAIVDGKAKKIPYIRSAADEKAPLLPGKEFVDANLKGYVPALMTAPAGSTTTAATNGVNGTGYPAQSGGTSTATPTGGADTRSTQRAQDGLPAPILPGVQRYLSPSEARGKAQ